MTSFRTIAAAILCIGSTAHAATFCVASAEDLTAALLAAQQNNDASNSIRIRAGHYTAPAGGWHVDIQHRGIVLTGGFLDAACQTASQDASVTVLDGHDAARPLTIDTSFHDIGQVDGQILISRLTFANGSGDVAGGLKISDSGPIYNGAIRVERNIFRNNASTVYQQDNSGGGLLAATDGANPTQTYLVVRNNLFVGNRAPEGAAAMLFSNNAIAVNGNTFVFNQASDQTEAPRTAVAVFTFSGMNYNNNIFWANNVENRSNTFDIRANNALGGGAAAKLFNNDLEAVTGTAGVQDSNLAVDPEFVNSGIGDFRLTSASALVDAGLNLPQEGGIGSADVEGSERILGMRVDIGAYESDPDVLFHNGFE